MLRSSEVSTFFPKKANLSPNLVYLDATDQIMGRLCSRVASILIGKHKPITTPGFKVGDKVVVYNASKIKFTGSKIASKIYYKHTGYIGNMKSESLGLKFARDPAQVLFLGVKGMLGKGPLGRSQLRMLRVIPGDKGTA